MRYAYPYVVQAEPGGGLFVSFPDVPEALTGAETDADVPGMAQDALVTALSFYTDAGRPIPVPSSGPALAQAPVVRVPVLVALKLALNDAMVAGGVSNVALAKRLGTDEKSVRRMRDPMQATKVDNLEAALRTLGRRAEVSVLEEAG